MNVNNLKVLFTSVSGRYALALFEEAQRMSCLEAVSESIEKLDIFFKESSQYGRVDLNLRQGNNGSGGRDDYENEPDYTEPTGGNNSPLTEGSEHGTSGYGNHGELNTSYQISLAGQGYKNEAPGNHGGQNNPISQLVEKNNFSAEAAEHGENNASEPNNPAEHCAKGYGNHDENNQNARINRKIIGKRELASACLGENDLKEVWKIIGENLSLHPLFLSFIVQISINKRLSIFNKIKHIFDIAMKKHNNKRDVTIESAIELFQNQKERINSLVNKLFSENSIINYRVNKDVLGGIKILSEGTIIDASVASQLKQISDYLNNLSVKV